MTKTDSIKTGRDAKVALTVTGLGAFLRLESAPGRRFRKEILRVGRWYDSSAKAWVEVDRVLLEKLARDSNRWIELGHKVPAPDGHTSAALATLGWWLAFEIEGDRLLGTFEAIDDLVASKVGSALKDVSVYARGPEVASNGERLEAVILHCCLTPYPVVTGQPNFVRLAKEASMPTDEKPGNEKPEGEKKREVELATDAGVLAAIKSKLGVAPDASGEVVLEALEACMAAATEEEEPMSEEMAKLAREVDGEKDERLKLAKELEAIKAERAKEQSEAAEREISLAREESAKSGSPISKEIEEKARALFRGGDAGTARLVLDLAKRPAGLPANVRPRKPAEVEAEERSILESDAAVAELCLARGIKPRTRAAETNAAGKQ